LVIPCTPEKAEQGITTGAGDPATGQDPSGAIGVGRAQVSDGGIEEPALPVLNC